VLRGERFTYNFLDSGDLLNGRVKFICPQLAWISETLPTDVTAGGVPRPAQRITANQPLQQVTNTGGMDLRWSEERQHYPAATGRLS